MIPQQEPRELRPEEAPELFARMRQNFTAADLQQYTEPFDGIPLRTLLEELEAKQKQIEIQLQRKN